MHRPASNLAVPRQGEVIVCASHGPWDRYWKMVDRRVANLNDPNEPFQYTDKEVRSILMSVGRSVAEFHELCFLRRQPDDEHTAAEGGQTYEAPYVETHRTR